MKACGIIFLAAISMALAAFPAGCTGRPSPSDVVGTWEEPGGAELIIKADGTFSGRALPVPMFRPFDRAGAPFDGAGDWKLEQNQGSWEIDLFFHEISKRAASVSSPVLVSGSGASTILFKWIGEEGGGRYELVRKNDSGH